MSGPMTLHLTQSAMRQFRACHRRYKFAAVDHLAPVIKAPALSIGTACHAGRAAWLTTFSKEATLAAVTASLDVEATACPALKEREPALLADKRTHAVWCKCWPCLTYYAQETMGAYADAWERRFGDSITVLTVEQPFQQEIMTYEGITLVYEGQVDATVRYNDLYLNSEFKTYGGKQPVWQYIREERLSHQHTIYPYHLERRVTGLKFYGTLLDVATKATRTQPATFDHDLIVKTDENYDEFEALAFEMLQQLVWAREQGIWTKNTDACYGKYNRPCDFLAICESGPALAVMDNYVIVPDRYATAPTEADDE